MLEQYPTVKVVHFGLSYCVRHGSALDQLRHAAIANVMHARLAARVVKFLSDSLPVNYHQFKP
jgi:hypothetical protein